MMIVGQGLSANMQLTIERMTHIEGIADQSHYGFVRAGNARLETVNHPLDLVSKYTAANLFGSYETRRSSLIKEILDDAIVAGFWDETLFPSIKDLVRYGADWLSEGNKTGQFVKAGVDAAAATLGALYP